SDLAQLRQTENLKAAGVRQDYSGPRHELVQAAEFTHQFMPGPQIEVISIRENDFGAEFFQRLLRERFYGGRRANRHEERRLHGAMRRSEAAATRPGRIGFAYLKRKIHCRIVSAARLKAVVTAAEGGRYMDPRQLRRE